MRVCVHQDDWEAYGKMNAAVGKKCQIVGDDLLVTNPVRVAKAIKDNVCNALLLKVGAPGVKHARASVRRKAAGAHGGVTVHTCIRVGLRACACVDFPLCGVCLCALCILR